MFEFFEIEHILFLNLEENKVVLIFWSLQENERSAKMLILESLKKGKDFKSYKQKWRHLS